MNSVEESRFEELLAWGKQHGATLHEQVEVYNDALTKYSLRVKASAPAPDHGFAVVKCPASVTLSYINALTGGPLPCNLSADTQLSPSFPASFMSSLPPHVIGRFFLIQQYLRGPQSFWYPYIRTLPQPERLASWALPAFWPEEDIEFFEGTNAEVAIREVQANVKGEFKQARRVLKEDGFPGWQDYSRLLYNWAFCMFTSRSFRPTTVLSEEVREGVRRILPTTCKDDDFSVLMPVMDIANHQLRAKVTWDTVSDPRACHFVSCDAYQPGRQIFNNYGMKTNSELLLGYGFIIPESEGLHNDYIHLRKRGPEGAEGNDPGGETKPKDFLVSLRPMQDPSSVVGRSRQRLRTGGDFEVTPVLSYIEDSLVWDLVVAQAGHDEQLREALESIVDKIRTALLAKLSFDYAKILDPEVYEDGEPALIPANQNQELAAAYRLQCKKILETGIKLLGGQLEGQGGDVLSGVEAR
ncbi:SET domain-containing protein [Coniochaeta ligniaria NRRL 30616]|uniref:SET domain-containing protein n=1 Tax=Coniochaeta ligniaria NRRL 30616 TaxID=1408157 RepID=A0A1J7IDN1_9PEZI|nr:SET domain-containing protein [Coniochaeta ligniaria NRRL 30616]